MSADTRELGSGYRSIVIGSAEAARDAIKRVLARLDIETVLEARSPAEAAACLSNVSAHLIIVGQRLVDSADVLACRTLREAMPGSRMVTLTWYATDRDWLVSMIAGASACLVWQARSVEQLTSIARRVLDGENLLAEEREGALVELVQGSHAGFSPIEASVAMHLARADTDSETAAATNLTLNEVRAYVVSILEKVAPARKLF